MVDLESSVKEQGKINIFIHTYKVNDWKLIRDEQLEYINNSGLGDVSDVHICSYDNELKTQLDMWKDSKSNDSYYLYLHNLGITWQGTKYEKITEKYRRWCLDGVVKNWKEYVSYLDEYDVVGDNYVNDKLIGDENPTSQYKDIVYSKHSANNNWWTKSSYVKKLENPLDYENKFPKLLIRLSWETWICSNKGQFKEVRQDFSLVP